MSWAQRDKTLQKTISRTKGKSLIISQIQEALWRKSNNLKPLLSRHEELYVS